MTEPESLSAPSVHSAVITISAWAEPTDPLLRARVIVAADGERVQVGVVRGVEALRNWVCEIVGDQFPSAG